MSRTLLVTGGAGFIGSNFVRFVRAQRPDWTMVNLDALTYSGNLENLAELEGDEKHRFVRGDICDWETVRPLMDACDTVVHFAAESHVDRSIHDASPFIRSNVLGTQNLLNAARDAEIQRFVHVSTDEVYGSLPLDRPDLKFTEESTIAPNSPYAASKAASDLLALSYHHTFGQEIMVTRCSNTFSTADVASGRAPSFSCATRILPPPTS